MSEVGKLRVRLWRRFEGSRGLGVVSKGSEKRELSVYGAKWFQFSRELKFG